MAKAKQPPVETDEKERTTFYLRKSVSEKLKSLAFQSRQTNTAILDQALTDYFDKWEKKNGKLPTR